MTRPPRFAAVFIASALGAVVIPAAALAQQAAPTFQAVTRTQVTAALDTDYAALDANKDGKATRAEIEARVKGETARQLAEFVKRRNDSFAKLDTNRDNSVSKAEFDAAIPTPKVTAADPGPVLAQFDANKDGIVTAAEFRAPTLTNFDKFDTNKDGTVSAAEQLKQNSR